MPTANYDKLLEPLSEIRITCESLLTGAFGDLGGDQRESIKTIYSCGGGLYALLMDIITSLGLTEIAKRPYLCDRFDAVLLPLLEATQSLMDELDGPVTEEQLAGLMFISEVGHSLQSVFGTLWLYSEALHRVGKLNKRMISARQLIEAVEPETAFPLTTICEIVPDVPPIYCDATRIRTAIHALLDNVARHSGSETAHIQVSRDSGMILISVRDKGNGIPGKAIESALEPFFQVDTIADGMGLGLPLAQAIAIWHGGHLQLRNDNGLVVDLYLPIET
ncbi:MAG: HAMP domain-containing histidine kinase [Anaerolineae bacterium]|nr:HAMP domain-containing histidine kinase [Anaerolineae bacterium]MCA9887570.1 HAMP domain-containing histidine kinase [Anaerolineae bacterium]MCA9895637.1 HAMP domain-containing histidine kinase [Anaerolineae bacterium]MCB9458768.1 HAMP domain-containing histidine kinase [Anaerolineaceae bacterium]